MPRFLLVSFMLGALAVTGPARAGTLFRCVDKNGVTAFTSSQAGYRQCKLVGNFPDSPKAAAPKAAAPAKGAGVGYLEFRTAAAGAEPKAAPTPAGAAPPRVTRGAVYKYTKGGVTHYTNRKPAGQNARVVFTYIESCFACNPRSAVDFDAVALNLTSYTDEVLAAAAEHGVDAALIRAIIHAESAFNPTALSRVGAQGLMQLMPPTAKRFGVTNAFDPQQNIQGGVKYLAWLLKRFNGNLTLAAAGYNAGEGAVDRHKGVPPYRETQHYVQRVAILADRYRGTVAAAPSASPGGLSAR
jgi:hypothetical protein